MSETAATAIPPFLFTGPELYDLIMGGIEPDLTAENMEKTKQAILDVTPEQRAEMAKRYDLAFAEYDKQAEDYQREWNEQFKQYKRNSMQQLEAQVQAAEGDLTSLESAMAAVTPSK